MELITKELMLRIPPLYSQEDVSDPMIHVKFFSPMTAATWYATEASAIVRRDGEEAQIPCSQVAEADDLADVLFFGYCHIHETEIGYFLLSDLKSVVFPIERDLYFGPQPVSEAKRTQPLLREMCA